MNGFVKLVCWQITFILFSMVASLFLNSFLDKSNVTFVLFIVSFLLLFASGMIFFIKSITLGAIIAAMTVSISIVVTLNEPSVPPLTLTPYLVGLMLVGAVGNLSNELEDWNIYWLLTTLVIEADAIFQVFYLDIGIPWFCASVGSVVLLALLALLGKSRAINSTSTHPA